MDDVDDDISILEKEFPNIVIYVTMNAKALPGDNYTKSVLFLINNELNSHQKRFETNDSENKNPRQY